MEKGTELCHLPRLTICHLRILEAYPAKIKAACRNYSSKQSIYCEARISTCGPQELRKRQNSLIFSCDLPTISTKSHCFITQFITRLGVGQELPRHILHEFTRCLLGLVQCHQFRQCILQQSGKVIHGQGPETKANFHLGRGHKAKALQKLHDNSIQYNLK